MKHLYIYILIIIVLYLGLLHDDLKLFVETNVPKPAKKKEKVTLGVADAKIGAAISEELGVNCLHTGVVPEVIRGQNSNFN